MKSSRQHSEINTGSMADIAFLLLIFFLVATTISTDKGINRQLPQPCPPDTDCTDPIKEKNLLRISINHKNEIFANDEIIPLIELKDLTKSFIDNNGLAKCDYCHGKGLTSFSDHPKNAVVSLKTSNDSSYEFYIAVQDELTKAYYELRANYAKEILGKSENNLSKSDINKLKKAYPFKLSESD